MVITILCAIRMVVTFRSKVRSRLKEDTIAVNNAMQVFKRAISRVGGHRPPTLSFLFVRCIL